MLFDISFHVPYQLILLMNAFAMTCSACNPLLYTLFSKKFRASISRLLCCLKNSKQINNTRKTLEITCSISKVKSQYTYIF